MPRIADLSAQEAATIAREIWRNKGERKASLKVIYYALAQDKDCPEALLAFSLALGTLVTEEIAAVISRYISNHVSDYKVKSRITFISRMSLASFGVTGALTPIEGK